MAKKRKKREKKHVLTCKICGEEFRSAMWWAMYCSERCANRYGRLYPRVHRDELERLKRAAGES